MQELDPGFGILYNSVNERPDWFEYSGLSDTVAWWRGRLLDSAGAKSQQ